MVGVEKHCRHGPEEKHYREALFEVETGKLYLKLKSKKTLMKNAILPMAGSVVSFRVYGIRSVLGTQFVTILQGCFGDNDLLQYYSRSKVNTTSAKKYLTNTGLIQPVDTSVIRMLHSLLMMARHMTGQEHGI